MIERVKGGVMVVFFFHQFLNILARLTFLHTVCTEKSTESCSKLHSDEIAIREVVGEEFYRLLV